LEEVFPLRFRKSNWASKSLVGSDSEYEKRYIIYFVEKLLEDPAFEQEIEKRRYKYEVWSINGEQTAGKAGGGTAELPPPSYPTNRTSESHVSEENIRYYMIYKTH